MNRIIRFSAIAMAVASLVSCVREVPAPTPNPRPDIPVVQDTVLATISFPARLSETISSAWTSKVIAYDNKNAEGYVLEPVDADGLSATLTGDVLLPYDMLYALYPQEAFGEFTDCRAHRAIPEQQAVKLIESSPVPQAAFVSLASSSFEFRSVATYAGVKLYSENVKLFTLTGLDGEDICGETEVDVYANEAELTVGAKVITVIPAEGEVFEAGTYYVEIAPGDYSGFRVVMTLSDGSVSEVVYAGPFTAALGRTVELQSEWEVGEDGQGTFKISSDGYIDVYYANKSNDKCIVMYPGGGYANLTQNEITGFLDAVKDASVTVVVCRYTLPGGGARRDITLSDAGRAVELAVRNKAIWGRYSKVGVAGCSAGGHLASYMTQSRTDIDFQTLLFAVTTMEEGKTHAGSRNNLLGSNPSAELVDEFTTNNHVTKDTPYTYISYSTGDGTVMQQYNCQVYAASLVEAGNDKFEEHFNNRTSHSLAGLENWPDSYLRWLENMDNPALQKPVVSVVSVAFSQAKVSWTGNAQTYNVYVDGVKKATIENGKKSIVLDALSNESSFSVKVEAVREGTSEMSDEVTFKTAGVRKCTKSTGTTFLCIDWDAVCRSRNDGYEQAYEVQICEDAACTKIVYDFVPYDGQKSVNPCFGNSSYFGQTKELQAGIECANYLTPTRVSIGGLYPATTYYVRVRTRESVKVQSRITQTGDITEKTLTNGFGDSEWSAPVAMTTDSERVADSKTVFYTGFNDFCVQSDYKAWAPGAVPYGFLNGVALSNCWIPWNHPSRDKSIGFAFYAHGTGQHQTNTWNFTKNGAYVNGLEKDAAKGQQYLVGRDKGSVNAITGDIAGWHFHQWTRPFMGMLGLDGEAVSVATPVIAPGQVPDAGAECTITFSAVARVRPQDNYAGTLEVRVYRAATGSFETIGTITADKLIPYAAGSVAGNYICDFTGHKHTFTANLKPGDAVELYNTKVGIILVDDILITKGVNIDNVDREIIEW